MEKLAPGAKIQEKKNKKKTRQNPWAGSSKWATVLQVKRALTAFVQMGLKSLKNDALAYLMSVYQVQSMNPGRRWSWALTGRTSEQTTKNGALSSRVVSLWSLRAHLLCKCALIHTGTQVTPGGLRASQRRSQPPIVRSLGWSRRLRGTDNSPLCLSPNTGHLQGQRTSQEKHISQI